MLFKKVIKGVIGYLHLEEFWLDCTREEQDYLNDIYMHRVLCPSSISLISPKFISTSRSSIGFLSDFISWTDSDKKWDLSRKIIKHGDIIIDEQTIKILDRHFFYQIAAESFYKQRDISQNAIELSKTYCRKDIQLYPRCFKEMKAFFGDIPRILTFKRLAIILESEHNYTEAIEVCELAQSYGLIDGTKGGYLARIEKLKKKSKKLT